MATLDKNGKTPDGWSPYGDTDKEIKRNMAARRFKPSVGPVIRVRPGVKKIADFLHPKK